jgi:hypothetical protein
LQFNDVQALTATDFGKSEDDIKSEENQGNVDEVVVPMLCNLAACCIQTKVCLTFLLLPLE